MSQKMTRMVLVAAMALALDISAKCADEPTPNDPRMNLTIRAARRAADKSRYVLSLPGSMREPPVPTAVEAASSIESITVAAYCHPLAPIANDVAAFELPTKYHDQLLSYFRRAELDAYVSTEDNEIGTAHIRFKGGTNLRICWFYTGHKSRLSFSCGGVRYVTTGDKFADDEPLASRIK